jgi:tRNA threonylcarbamoyl adenosine modification protein (Sua5/YciO/YrdC/YwlC family)
MASAKSKILVVNPVRPEPALISEATRALRFGGLIILPTETVYGVAADPSVDGAVERIYAAKERDRGKPIPLLVSGMEAVERQKAVFPLWARRLAQRYWPGPLTLVLKCGARTEGFRVPDHAVALAVLKAAGGILRVTSANISGSPAARTVTVALEALGDSVALALDAGPAGLGVESTVVDATGAVPVILRQGALSGEAVMARPLVLFVCTGNTCRSPMAAVLARHWLWEKSQWEVDSAGVSAIPGQRASVGAIDVMAEKKLDLEDHRSQILTQARIDAADLVVVMTEAHKRAVILRFPCVAGRVVMLNEFNARHQGEDVPDPFGMKADVYRTIRDEIEAAMPELVMRLRGLYRPENRVEEGLRQ